MLLAGHGPCGKTEGMTTPLFHLTLASPDATARFAAELGEIVRPGDTIMLDGPIGSGKTLFARSLIQARLAADGAPPEDVPSPTFTLVQTYETGTVEIWHADLYRITHPDEVEELGLTQAFEQAICLVEWPDRLGDLAPARALTLEFSPGEAEEARNILVYGASDWRDRLEQVISSFATAREK